MENFTKEERDFYNKILKRKSISLGINIFDIFKKWEKDKIKEDKKDERCKCVIS